ncbi:hypothetical protein BDV18DRAFT_142762 [Aspergillus unguis]
MIAYPPIPVLFLSVSGTNYLSTCLYYSMLYPSLPPTPLLRTCYDKSRNSQRSCNARSQALYSVQMRVGGPDCLQAPFLNPSDSGRCHRMLCSEPDE